MGDGRTPQSRCYPLHPGFSGCGVRIHEDDRSGAGHLFRELGCELMHSAHVDSGACAQKVCHMMCHAIVPAQRVADGQHQGLHGLGSLDAIEQFAAAVSHLDDERHLAQGMR